ncbi:MAG: glycosyltransferase, partial [Promethearchaeota archaeon]
MSKSKIFIIFRSAKIGGTEKILVSYCNILKDKGWDVYICVFDNSEDLLKKLNVGIKVFTLPTSRFIFKINQMLNIINDIKPNIVLTSISGMNRWVTLLRVFYPRHCKVVIRESTLLNASLKRKPFYKIQRISYKLAYKNSDIIIAPSMLIKDDLIKLLGNDHKKIILIP